MQLTEVAKGASILAILDAARRRKFYVIVPALVLTVCVGAFASRLPNSYRAQALLAVERPPASDLLRMGGTPGPPGIQEQLRVIRETLFARPLLQEVLKEFTLYGPATDPDWATEDMKKRIRIQVEGTDAFYIGFEDGDRQAVAEVANRLAELFVKSTSASQEQNVEEAAGLLDQELARLRDKLADEDEEIKEYKQKVGEELPEHLGTNLKLVEALEMRLQAKRDSIGENQARRAQVLEEMKGLQKEPAQEIQRELPVEEPTAEQKALDEKRLKLKELEAKYTEQYPEIPRLRKEIADLEQAVAASPRRKSRSDATAAASRRYPGPDASMRYLALKGELEGIDQRLRSYAPEEKALQAEIASLRQRVASAPKHERALAEMTREQALTRSQYQGLLEKQNEMKMAERLRQKGQSLVFKVVEPASVPSAPSSPKRERILLLGFVGSLGLGVVLAFLVEQLDTSFDSADDFKTFTNLPLLAVIPSVRSKSRSGRKLPEGGKGDPHLPQPNLRHLQKNRVVTVTDPGAIASEQYSILAMKLRWHLGEAPSRVLTVTSASGGEGKTLTAVNLSFALAESGLGKVLLLDADLRKPRTHEYLGIEPRPALSNLLQDPERDIYREAVRLKDLFVIPGGSDFENPVGVLGSERMRRLVERLRLEFRFIVLDAPPILPIADPQVLAGYADGVLLVVRARRTRRELFKHAIESFRATNVLGVVLNGADYAGSRYARAYEYYRRTYYKQNIRTGT